MTSDASLLSRSARGIAALDPEQFLVATSLRGTSRIEQGDRATAFGPGELSSWDSSHPFAVTHTDAFDLLLIVVPRALLGPRRDAICARTAGRLDGSLAGPFFRGVWRSLEDGGAASEDIADALVALVRALHARERAAGARRCSSRSRRSSRSTWPIRCSPRTRSRGRTSSPPATCTRSSRDEDMSVSEWIRHRRLEACRRDLLDPALAHETISVIARRWALANPAHFSRAFRAAYGCTPSELRALR